MNKSFVLFDKVNNLQKVAVEIVKFNFEGRDYLVYSVDENEQNSQIFVSRLVLNSEGKYFIDNILADEKGKLNNIVYNIVILIPSEAQKGNSYDSLVTNFLDKFSVKLISGFPEIGVQEYYNNCSVAITSKLLVDAAVKYYDQNLNLSVTPNITPTWTAPVEVAIPTPVNVGVAAPVTSTPVVSVQESAVVSTPNLQVNTVTASPQTLNQNETVNVVSTPTPVVPANTVDVVQPNPQVEKLAIVSDPSLGIGVQQPNVGKNKEAGFANTKYIIIGTVCLVLSIAVVVGAFVLINNIS
jgi:hypothetical protein